MTESLSNEQRALVGIGLGVVPAVLGKIVPGGLLHKDGVSPDLASILVATAPWTLSIAAIVWFLGWVDTAQPGWHPLAVAAACAAILALGASAGAELVPTQAKVTEDQAASVEYYVLANLNPGVTASAGSNPRVGAAIAIAGVLVFIGFVYLVLYGLVLWLAGVVCGCYIGVLLHKSFTERPVLP